jgi:creatinine amidohydrolase
LEHLLTTATSRDVREGQAGVAVLPVGSCEQHGDHLPLITDTVVACVIAREISDAYGLWLLPPITISCSHEHAGWAGTVSISPRTLHQLINDIAESARTAGVDKLVIVNGHGGNYVLSNVVQEANVAEPRMTLFPTRDDWTEARRAGRLETADHEDMHGGELEVSILLHAHPDLVQPSIVNSDYEAPKRTHLLVLGMRGYTRSGIIGRPSLATAEKGKAVIHSLVQSCRQHLRILGQADNSGA